MTFTTGEHQSVISGCCEQARTYGRPHRPIAVKDQLADHNVAADFYDALDNEVAELLEDAARRTEENDRKTVQPRDL